VVSTASYELVTVPSSWQVPETFIRQRARPFGSNSAIRIWQQQSRATGWWLVLKSMGFSQPVAQKVTTKQINTLT
jgi:hypothetical protein